MFRIAAWLGVATTLVGLFLMSVFPREIGPLPAGMRTPIIAFELARSRDEVETMFRGQGDYDRDVWTRAMDAGNTYDYLFLVLYGLFFMAFSRGLMDAGSKSARVGRAIASLPSAMDALENLQLLAITKALGGEYGEALGRLAWLTWAKWLGIAVIFASWIPALWSRGTLGRITAALALLTVISTVTAFFVRGVAAELMGLGVALTVLGALTFAFVSSRQLRR